MAKKGGLQPHRIRYWMNPVIEDEAKFVEQLSEIVDLNTSAADLAKQGVRVVSCDEKTGMQAIERLDIHPLSADHPERQEAWYRRHGVLCLIASLDLATGKLLVPTVRETRGNADFVQHVQQTVDTDPTASWVFIVDNLNTHTSESLVQWVAKQCGLHEELGCAGKSGVLHNATSRARFLSEPTHRIRFAYTPRHCSWLNEIERWFSKLARAVLRRGSFTSKEALQTRILDYVRYYNVVSARPARWVATAESILRKLRIGT